MQEPSHEQLQRWAAEYKAGTISENDKAIFEAWLFRETGKEIQWPGTEAAATVQQEMRHNIEQAIQPRVIRNIWIRYVAAASVIIAMALGVYWFNQSPNKPAIAQTSDALPGKEGAILTLADGRQVVLDSLATGVIATDHGSEVLLQNGQLLYHHSGNKPEVYNTLTTPKGRIYQLLLSDGTTVWLNSSSSITYPLSFTGDARKVSITGEVYFEVVKNKQKPFLVNISPAGGSGRAGRNSEQNQDRREAEGGYEITVLGTSFNVNAYNDERHISTTLLEGKVRITQQGNSSILNPGQQALSDRQSNAINIKEADTEEVMAWKNGFFHFDNADLATVLRQLSRWYDVDVKYEGAVPDKKLVGEIQKDSKLSEVLKALEYTGVKFQIQGKTIIVNE